VSFAGNRFAFRSCGEDVTIYEWVRILHPELINVGSHVIIDDFVFIDGSGGIAIGSHVHIASFASLVGGGRIVVGDFAGIAGGSRLVSGSDRFDGSGLTGPTIPDRWRSVERSRIELGRHAVLGTNVVVHPGVTIGDGTIVGSNSLVTRDLPPWTICVGTPAEPVGERPRETMLEYERALLEHDSSS
jgi:acetyltransferase-like isoleucine patch superfamily enzyme